MALQETEWPSSIPVPSPIKHLLARFFEVGDSKSDDAGRVLAEEIFAHDGKIVVNKRAMDGAEGKPELARP